MYLRFYDLEREPFQVTPDPGFLLLTESHKAALGSMVYGVTGRKGFVAVFGEVGVGKTTVLRAFLDRMRDGSLRTVYLFNTRISFPDLLRMVYAELDVVPDALDDVGLLEGMNRILLEEHRQGRTVALLIDEAQNMPVETLEGLRMLSNLETRTEKLLQIVLVGQPELERKLRRPELRQLDQRMAVRATILPLTKPESVAYIAHRLEHAGGSLEAVFTRGALREIVRRGRGVPRILNVLCDNALVTGYGHQEQPVTARVVREVIRDWQGRRAPALSWRRVALGGALAVAALGGVVPLATRSAVDEGPEGSPARPTLPVPQPASERVALPPPIPRQALRQRVVRRGESLSQLVSEAYGRFDPGTISAVLGYNPQIASADRIVAGQVIVLPSLDGPASLDASSR